MKIFLITLIIAVLSGMGVGGGGLLVIYLTLAENVEQIVAQGANLCFFIIAAISSTLFNIKKRKIVWKNTLILSAVGILFSLLGGYLAGIINPKVLKKIFGIMLILGGSSSLISAFVEKKQNKSI